ncbi:MAG: K(+)-transporting ATPase subunit F [Candidatus Omnitrophica bacterium]|nr:K(+)-transporting ATPase subunit F [Candidatus Omnitrophota bacterium]
MLVIYWIGGILVLGLLVYLFLALLKPEMFS